MKMSVVDIEAPNSSMVSKYGRRSYKLMALVALVLAGVIGTVVWWQLRGDTKDVELIDKSEDLVIVSAVKQGTFSMNQVTGTYTIYLRSFGNGTQSYEFGLSSFSAPSCTSGDISVLLSVSNEASNSTDISLAITSQPTQRLNLPTEYTLQHEDVSIMCGDEDFGAGNTTTTVPVEMLNPIVKTGTFSGAGNYVSTGRCSIVRKSDIVNGNAVISYALHFEDIKISSGPDVFLYLTTDASPTDVDSSSLRIELDGVRFFAKTGTFMQDLPSDFDPDVYNGATSWCRGFGVLFGTLAFN